MRNFSFLPKLLLPVLGMIISFYPTLFSGFARMQFDPGDTRLVMLFLEHAYRWFVSLLGTIGFRPEWFGLTPSLILHHHSFWSPPFFYPASGVLSYSENLIGSLPIYAVFRFFGADMDSAMQLWMMTFALLNYLAFLWVLNSFPLGAWARYGGAFFFAFANARMAQLGHPQLLPQAVSIVALGGLLRSFRPEGKPGHLLLFYGTMAWQFLASVYLGWFAFFSLGLLALIAVSQGETRKRVGNWFCRFGGWHVLGGCGLIALLVPVLSVYLSAGRQVGYRDFGQTLPMIPEIRTWFNLGADNLIYGWIHHLPQYAYFPYEIEHRIGLGLVTWAICLWGLFGRQMGMSHKVRLFFSLLFICAFHWKGRTLWYPIFNIVPGANAIRSVTRISLFLLIPLALGLAFWIERFGPKRWAWGILACCLLEQISLRPSFEKAPIQRSVQALSARLGTSCRQFFYFDPKREDFRVVDWSYPHLEAMEIAWHTGIPTLNGYSGSFPAGWHLQRVHLGQETSQAAETELKSQVTRNVAAWLNQNQITGTDLCWLNGSE